MSRLWNEPTDEELDEVLEQIEQERNAEDIEVLTDPSSIEQMSEDISSLYGDS